MNCEIDNNIVRDGSLIIIAGSLIYISYLFQRYISIYSVHAKFDMLHCKRSCVYKFDNTKFESDESSSDSEEDQTCSDSENNEVDNEVNNEEDNKVNNEENNEVNNEENNEVNNSVNNSVEFNVIESNSESNKDNTETGQSRSFFSILS